MLDVVGDALDNHHEGHQIFAALGDDYVGVALGGLHELLMHGLHGAEILLRDGFEAPAPVAHIPLDAPQQAHVDAPPSPRRTIRPKYPEGARRRHEEGAVTLDISVDANGAVVGVEVVEPGLFAELRDAAVKAVRAVRFKPATAGDKPVPAKVRLTLDFRLKDR